MLLAGAIAFAPAHAFAAPTEAPLAEVVAPDDQAKDAMSSEDYLADSKAKMQREMDEAIAMIEKIFEIDKLPPVDPARLALARQTTAALIPQGALAKMIDNMYGKIFKAVMEQASAASDLSISIKTGVESEQVAALDAPTKEKIADLFDPNRKEREDQVTKVIKPLIEEALGDLEAPMREGLAYAYSRKFSGEQLTQLNSFFATPTGQLYANESMALQADPEVMLAVAKAVPPMVTKFMDRGPELEGQFKDLPKEKSLADMSDAELSKLAKLMKVNVKVLKEHRDQWDAPVEEATEAMDASTDSWDATDGAADAAADAAVAAADAAVDDAGDADPAMDRANWSAADLKRVEDLEEAANTASSSAWDAEQEAVANARKKAKPTSRN